MSFLSSSVSMTRYRLLDEPTRELLNEVPERLRKYAFQDIDHTADERSFGWVAFDDWLDPAWKSAPPEKGEWFAFSLRLDTRRVSPAVFKKYFEMAVREHLAGIQDEKKRFISKDRKRELKDQVQLKLRARSLPIPAVFPAAWNTRTGEVWLASTNSKTRGLFEDLFTLTFELGLEPLTPFFQAARMLGEEALPRLEGIEPSDFAL